MSKPVAALFIVLNIAALAGFLLSLAIVGLHIQQDLVDRLKKNGACPALRC